MCYSFTTGFHNALRYFDYTHQQYHLPTCSVGHNLTPCRQAVSVMYILQHVQVRKVRIHIAI